MRSESYVVYYRGRHGGDSSHEVELGAQKSRVGDFIGLHGGEVVSELVEVEKGRGFDREQLGKAIALCRKRSARLLVAKAGRLTMSLRFLSQLKDGNVDFYCCDVPDLNLTSIETFIQKAERTRDRIASGTKEGLLAARDKGVKLGNPRLDDVRTTDLSRANDQRKENADAFADYMKAIIRKIYIDYGITNPKKIADALNEGNVPAKRGGKWSAIQVKRIIRRWKPE